MLGATTSITTEPHNNNNNNTQLIVTASKKNVIDFRKQPPSKNKATFKEQKPHSFVQALLNPKRRNAVDIFSTVNKRSRLTV